MDLRAEAEQLSICVEHFLYASERVVEGDYKTKGFYDNCIEKCNGRLKAIHFLMESIRQDRPVSEEELEELDELEEKMNSDSSSKSSAKSKNNPESEEMPEWAKKLMKKLTKPEPEPENKPIRVPVPPKPEPEEPEPEEPEPEEPEQNPKKKGFFAWLI